MNRLIIWYGEHSRVDVPSDGIVRPQVEHWQARGGVWAQDDDNDSQWIFVPWHEIRVIRLVEDE